MFFTSHNYFLEIKVVLDFHQIDKTLMFSKTKKTYTTIP